MPLSEHEQRMLDEIESALYAEDPKFVSAVRGSGRGAWARGAKRKFQAAFVMALGLALLIVGIAVPVLRIGGPQGFSAIAVLGFLVMFGGGVMLMFGGGGGDDQDGGQAATSKTRGGGGIRGRGGNKARKQRSGGGFATRMEDRFRRRFDQ